MTAAEREGAALHSVSVIVPCRNERGTVEAAAVRIPDMGASTEIIFCNDRSTDGTGEEITRVQNAYPGRNIRSVTGPGRGKAWNVFRGFEEATGDILIILDGDLTVEPEELPLFYRALTEGRGGFINGSRMVHPRERSVMSRSVWLGNRLFGVLFSLIIGQRLTDTLCGTKALWRRDWDRIRPLVGSWGIEDRWGDHELLFGAALLRLQIAEVPVHYGPRTYGDSKMRHRPVTAIRMLAMGAVAAARIRMAR